MVGISHKTPFMNQAGVLWATGCVMCCRTRLYVPEGDVTRSRIRALVKALRCIASGLTHRGTAILDKTTNPSGGGKAGMGLSFAFTAI